MKVRPSVKPMCDKCKVIKRNGKVMVICSKDKSHTHRQGYNQLTGIVPRDRILLTALGIFSEKA